MKLIVFICLTLILATISVQQYTKVTVSGSKPEGRRNSGLVYDKKQDRLILFGGLC